MENNKIVRDFKHILLWPVQLRSLRARQNAAGTDVVHFWDILRRDPGPWQYVDDALLIEDASCKIGYEEFVYFLPYVQRFLYGVGDEGRGAQSSLHIFTRDDIAELRIQLRPERDFISLRVDRVRLYFFYDIDVALVAFEVVGHELLLEDAVEIMDRLGRPYPPSWEPGGQGSHCPHRVELLGAGGQIVAQSDYGDYGKYLELVRQGRQTPLATHWEYLLSPLVPAYKDGGTIKYYQLENKRIPIMSYLAFDDPHQLSRGDMMRLGFAAKWGPSDTLP
jgi:hypothetical protein